MGDGEFRVELRGRERGPHRPRRSGLPDPAEPGDATRPRRRDRIGGRALAYRPRARGRSRWRDAGLRRDRCGHRWRHRAPRRRDAGASRGARTGDHDHAPAADRERGRDPFPGREGPRRSDAHPDRASSRPTSAARSSSGCSVAGSSSPGSPRSPARERDRRHSAAREAHEGSRQASATRRSRDHRPCRSRPRLRRGARGVRRARGRERRTVELGAIPESRPARARAGRRLPGRCRRLEPVRAAVGRRDGHGAREAPSGATERD